MVLPTDKDEKFHSPLAPFISIIDDSLILPVKSGFTAIFVIPEVVKLKSTPESNSKSKAFFGLFLITVICSLRIGL